MVSRLNQITNIKENLMSDPGPYDEPTADDIDWAETNDDLITDNS